MYSENKAWFALMDKLADMTITYAKSQIRAGAKAIIIFDSWVGQLSAADYRIFTKPTMEKIFLSLKEEKVPLMMFGVGASHLVKEWHDLPLDVIGLDWRIQIKEARELGITKTIQGNLDPSILLAPWNVIEEQTKMILDQGMIDPGFIFNLGHGVYPEVNPDTLNRLTAFVHNYSANK